MRTLRLLASAADHYVTALLGLPPLGWIVQQITGVLRYGPPSTSTDLAVIVYDGEIIEEKNDG